MKVSAREIICDMDKYGYMMEKELKKYGIVVKFDHPTKLSEYRGMKFFSGNTLILERIKGQDKFNCNVVSVDDLIDIGEKKRG